jgi:FtsP/CotA-like multicopper oxidase with cupredoxin domain
MRHPISRRAVIRGIPGFCAAIFADGGPLAAQTLASKEAPSRLLEARPGEATLLAEGAKTACLTYGGAVPGPVLRVKKDEMFNVRLANKLDTPTTLHWHGLRGANAMDGIGGLTQKPVPPGEFFDVAFKATDPGLLLYRPAALPWSPKQIASGLGGILIVEEPQPPEVDAERVLLFQDWTLDPKGKLVDAAGDAPVGGRIGTLLTADCKPVPFTETIAPGARIRLRLANAATARILIVVFENLRSKIIAIDGQPCDPFEPVRQTIPIAPGARFDLLVDVPTDAMAEPKLILRDIEGRLPDSTLVAWTLSGAAAKTRPPIASLPLNPLLPPEIKLGQAKKLELVLEPPKGAAGRWTIGGENRTYAGKPLFSVPHGTPVSIGFANRATVSVPMHVHGHVVRLLHDLDDGWEPYWRNAIIVPPGRTKHVAFLADQPGKWALRSDILDQEAAGLSAWFEIT